MKLHGLVAAAHIPFDADFDDRAAIHEVLVDIERRLRFCCTFGQRCSMRTRSGGGEFTKAQFTRQAPSCV
jgi:hypothetical protein